MEQEIRRTGERARATDARPWRALRPRRLGPGPEHFEAFETASAMAQAEVDASIAAAKADARSGGRNRALCQERFNAALDSGNRANAALRAIAWCDPFAAARMQAADRALDAATRVSLAAKAGDPEARTSLKTALHHWYTAADAADGAIARAVSAVIARDARAAASRRHSRSRQRRSHRTVAKTAGGDSGDDPASEPPGNRRYLPTEVAP